MKGEFFDSYGKHPIHYNKYFLDLKQNRNGVQWEQNKIEFQSASLLSVDNIVYIFVLSL